MSQSLVFELQQLPSSALAVLRYFAQSGNHRADEGDLMVGASLTERSLSTAMKQLITQKYVTMDVSDWTYQLTEKGLSVMGDLAEVDRERGQTAWFARDAEETEQPERVSTQHYRLQMVLAEPLIVGERVAVYAGVTSLRAEERALLVLRLSAIHATVHSPTEHILDPNTSATQAIFYITPERFKQARLRLEAYYLDDLSGDWFLAGGMYFDTDLAPSSADVQGEFVTYGTQIAV